jgi:hypothetical protein
MKNKIIKIQKKYCKAVELGLPNIPGNNLSYVLSRAVKGLDAAEIVRKERVHGLLPR